MRAERREAPREVAGEALREGGGEGHLVPGGARLVLELAGVGAGRQERTLAAGIELEMEDLGALDELAGK